jgi:HD domain
MDDASRLVEWAREWAATLLEPLGNRWLHVQGVAETARLVGGCLAAAERDQLVAAAYLHDIGYAKPLACSGFHPLDGARFVRSLGQERLARLVAHHSEARIEADERGLGEELADFPWERSAVADALTYCDLTTGPAGARVPLAGRLAEIFERYGDDHVVTRSLRRAQPHLTAAVARTERLLARAGLDAKPAVAGRS